MKRIFFLLLFVVAFLIAANVGVMFFHWVTLEKSAEDFLEPTPIDMALLPIQPPPEKKHFHYPSAKVALVIDDLGVKTPQYLLLLDIPYKVNLAIIPGLKNSKELVKEFALLNRFELLLHMPMEPFPHRGDQESQGASGIRTYPFFIDRQTKPTAIPVVLDAAMNQLEGWGFIKGINNHMGSYVTSSSNIMTPILNWAKSRQLYMLDSLTSRTTVAYEMARYQHVQAYHNEIFLDGVDDPEAIEAQLRKAVTRARSEGQIVAICHITRKNTMSVLQNMMPKYAENGISFVWLSEL